MRKTMYIPIISIFGQVLSIIVVEERVKYDNEIYETE